MTEQIPPDNADSRLREVRQLRRLETLIDCVFALVIILNVFDLPMPEDTAHLDVTEFIIDSIETIAIAVISVVVILVYWFQSNVLLGDLKRTDAIHGSLSILQVLFVLFYLVAVGLGYQWGKEPVILAAQSATAALVGLMAALAWWYATSRANLVRNDLEADYVAALRLRVFAEPLTALLTLMLAFVAPSAWDYGWFAYPLVAALLRRLGVGSTSADSR